MLAGSAGKTMRISPGKRYPNDQAQHLNTTYRIVGPVSASCGQTIPTFEPNRDANIYGRNMLHAFGHLVTTCCDKLRVENRTSAHDWAQHCCTKTWPNDYNIMQHPQMLREKFDLFQIWTNNTQHVATHRNASRQGGQTHSTCCTQQCRDMLRWNVVIVWPGL